MPEKGSTEYRKKGLREKMKRKHWTVIAAALIIILLTGSIWQFIMERVEDKKYPPPGSYVSTEAYDMHYVSKGEGETAIVFIAGSGTPCAYTDFYNLQESLSFLGQTISFDHAGSGWSSDTDEARTVEKLEEELTTLLDVAAPEKRVILVAHSLGVLEAIYFAQTHPEKVIGLVFLDSGDPEFYRADSEMTAKLLNRGIAFMRTIGLNRLLGNAGIPIPFYGESDRIRNLPEEACAIDKAMFFKHAGSKETLKAIGEMNENAEKVVNGPRLGKTGVLVLSSDSGTAWSMVQSTLASWSENSRQVTIENAKHYLHWSDAEMVEEQIRAFVTEILGE